MRIAILGNIPHRIALDTPAGTEVFTYYLLEQLQRTGHTLSLFASRIDHEGLDARSYFSFEEFQEKTQDLSVQKYQNILSSYQNLLISDAIAGSGEFDIIHNNMYLSSLVFPFSKFSKSPIVHTVHNDLFQHSFFAHFANRTLTKNDFLVYVSSYAQKKSKISTGKSCVIHNGIDPLKFRFSEIGGNTMMWLGRASPTKGLVEAIKAQQAVKRPLTLLVNVNEPRYKDFFTNTIAPLINDQSNIKVIDHITFDGKIAALADSKLFLFPMQWEEPFGLVMIEAMACGTPIITYARGASAEIVEDGVTGFLVNPADDDIRGDWTIKKTGIEGIQEAIERLYSLPDNEYIAVRKACRARVEKYFTIERMAKEYIDLYSKLSQ